MTVSGVTVFDHRIYGMLGKLKRRRSPGVGAAATLSAVASAKADRHGPLSTSHRLSTIKGSIRGCLPVIFSEIFQLKFSRMCGLSRRAVITAEGEVSDVASG